MRLLSILTALVVVSTLYLVVFERERLLEFAGVSAAQPTSAEMEDTEDQAAAETADKRVTVVALRSQARQIDGAVIVICMDPSFIGTSA